MTDEKPSPEQIAALLDGRLDEPARAAVLAKLAASNEDFETLLDTAAVLAELGGDVPARESPAAPPVARRPTPPLRAWRRPPGHWLAVAAVLVGVAVLPWAWSRLAPPAGADPTRFVVLLAPEPGGLPPVWAAHPWGTTRAGAEPLSRAARSARVGALLTDLELAVRHRDSAAVVALALTIAPLVDSVDFGPPVGETYRVVARQAGAPSGRLRAELRRGVKGISALLDDDLVALGAWAEAARVAARQRDAAFFASRATTMMLRRASALDGVPADGRTALAQLQAPADRRGDWPAVAHAVDLLLRSLAEAGASRGGRLP